MTEPEPPAGGFLWDLMDHLWFTGTAPTSHLQHRLGTDDAFIPFDPVLSRKTSACFTMLRHSHTILPNRCCLVGDGVSMVCL